MWHRIGTRGRLLGTVPWISGFHEILGISCRAEELFSFSRKTLSAGVYSKNKFEKLLHLVWLDYENLSRCTFSWMSNSHYQTNSFLFWKWNIPAHRGLVWTHSPIYAVFVWCGGGWVLLLGIICSCVSSVSNYFGGLAHCSTELKFLLVLPLTQLLVLCLRDLLEGGHNLSSCWLRYQILTWRGSGWIFRHSGCPCHLQYPFPCIGQGQIFEELCIKILCTVRDHIWTMNFPAENGFNL